MMKNPKKYATIVILMLSSWAAAKPSGHLAEMDRKQHQQSQPNQRMLSNKHSNLRRQLKIRGPDAWAIVNKALDASMDIVEANFVSQLPDPFTMPAEAASSSMELGTLNTGGVSSCDGETVQLGFALKDLTGLSSTDLVSLKVAERSTTVYDPDCNGAVKFASGIIAVATIPALTVHGTFNLGTSAGGFPDIFNDDGENACRASGTMESTISNITYTGYFFVKGYLEGGKIAVNEATQYSQEIVFDAVRTSVSDLSAPFDSYAAEMQGALDENAQDLVQTTVLGLLAAAGEAGTELTRSVTIGPNAALRETISSWLHSFMTSVNEARTFVGNGLY